MAIFIETPRFPDDMAYWATGGAQHNTTVVQLNSGFEQRNINWSQHKAVYSLNSAQRTQANNKNIFTITETIAFFNAVQGRAYGFRFKDFQDFQVSLNSGTLETGFGNGYPNYQLCKAYIKGVLTNRKQIKKPVNNALFNVYRNSSLLVKETDYTVDFTSGIVTFKPTKNINIGSITATENPTVTTGAAHGLTVGQKIYLTEIGSNPLNNLVFDILTIVNANSFTIKASNPNVVQSTGKVQLYPQPTDLLRWEGEFDKPCRFDNDNIDYSVSDGGLIDISNFKIVEIRI